MLSIEDVALSHAGTPILHSMSMEMAADRPNVLLGATGAGKTTLLRIIAGLEKPSSGRICLNGVDITDVTPRKRNVAMVYQSFINYPQYTVFENIASPLKVRGLGREDIRAEVERAARQLRIDAFLDRKPAELSGGQQQRVAIARAIVKKADLVLLDEPLANLDFKLREELRAELPGILSEQGAVLVYATSEPAEALSIGGATAALKEGRLAQFGPAQDVYRAPQNIEAAEVCSDPPLNTLPEPGGAGLIAFRGHHLQPGEAGEGETGFDVTVTSIEITGSETFVHLAMNGRRWVMLLHGVRAYQPGTRMPVHVGAEHLMRFDAAGRRG